MKKQLDAAGITNQDAALRQAAGQAFYNASPFMLRDLKARPKAQFRNNTTHIQKVLSQNDAGSHFAFRTFPL